MFIFAVSLIRLAGHSQNPRDMKLLIVLPTLLAAGVLSTVIRQPKPDIIIKTTIDDDETPLCDAAQ